MKRILLPLILVSLWLAGPSHASTIGQCDALLAKFFGDAHQVVNGIDVGPNCDALLGRTNDFVDAGCVPLLDTGQLFSAHLRLQHSLIQAVCGSLVCDCGIPVVECTGVVSCD